MLFRSQHDAVAGFEAMRDQPARQAENAVGELAIAPGMNAVADSWVLRLSAGDVKQMCREVQLSPLRDL